MKLFGADTFYTTLLLVTSVNAFSLDLSKRALKYDKSCDVKYGKLTAKQLIDKSIDFQPKLAKAGKDGLDTLIAALEFESKAPGAKKPTASKAELDKIIATYRVLFGDIKAMNEDGSPNPNFKKEAATHIAAIKDTRDSLNRMTKPGKPDLIIHCNDDWLSPTKPKGATAEKPPKALKPGNAYLYDTDRKQWISVKGGKPCQGQKATFTSKNRKLAGSKREKGQERITFCDSFFKQQQQLEKDGQPHLWDISKSKLPDTFTTYTAAGVKDKALPFHISAFGNKIGAKWFRGFMTTELFNPAMNKFSDKRLSNSQNGTSGVAYGFQGAVGLAKQKGGQNVAESSHNIENILYWSLAMYYDKWLWSTGNPEDPSTLSAPAAEPAQDEAASVEGKLRARAPKKGSKKTTKAAEPEKTEAPAEPAKTEKPAEPAKTEKPADPPKTEKPADPPKTSAAAAPPPASSQAPTAPPASSKASASSMTTPAPGTSKPTSGTASISNTASVSSAPHSSCSNTLCTVPSASASASSTSSGEVPQETFESEPMNAGSMTAEEILAVAGTVATEQVAAMALWDKALGEMGLPSGSAEGDPSEIVEGDPNEAVEGGPSETVEGDPTASLGTGLPMATGGLGGAANGTWSMPKLRTRDGVRERRMYDFAS